MKRTLAVVLLLTMSATVADLTGKWSGSFRASGADHDVPQFFILRQDGNKLTGSGGPDQSEQYPLENGTVDGDKIKFELTTGEWKFAYKMTATDSKMTGDLELKSMNSSRTAKVSLSRAK
ncbi:MAG: hypothetical protein WBQ08_09430 [Candidatus Sulfotelmatobacter sp.]